MPQTPFAVFRAARRLAPYLWGFASAAAIDHAVDVQTLFAPTLAAALMTGGFLLFRSAGR